MRTWSLLHPGSSAPKISSDLANRGAAFDEFVRDGNAELSFQLSLYVHQLRCPHDLKGTKASSIYDHRPSTRSRQQWKWLRTLPFSHKDV